MAETYSEVTGLKPSDNPGNPDSAPHVTLPDVPSKIASYSDMELANYCRQLFQIARQHRRPYVAQWLRNDRLLRNKTWSNTREAWLPATEVPEIRPIVSSMTGWMTDQRPTFDAVPAAAPGTPYYDFIDQLGLTLTTVMQANSEVLKYSAAIKMAVWDSFVIGTGLMKSSWDMSLEGGLGNAILERVDPYTFYPDPNATNERDGDYYIQARNMSLQELDRRYRAGYLFPNGNTEDIDVAPTMAKPGVQVSRTPFMSRPDTGTGYASYGPPGANRIHAPDLSHAIVTVLECWIREHVVTIMPDGQESVYDYWRVIVVAGEHVLLNLPAFQLWSHAQHPFERFVADDEGEFWGNALVGDLGSCQVTLNRLLASLQHNLELTGNPPFMDGARSNLSRTLIPNRPGVRIPSDPGSSGWMQVPQLNPMIPQLIQFYVTEMERISGLSAINRGFVPQGRNAADVIDSVQDAGFVRIRSHLRSLSDALRSAYEKLATLVVENYTTPRLMAITGPEGQAGSLALISRHFFVPTSAGAAPLRFTIMISADSTVSEMERKSEAVQLFTLGAIDRSALLEAFRTPNRKMIAERITKLEVIGAFNPPGARQRARKG